MTDDTPPVDREIILPGNATPLERAIADTEGRLDDIDTDLVRRVKAIEEAPSAYLPQIAYERSVDVWDQDWPEDVQRDVDRVAPRVHQRKGSPFAVRTALDALKISARIVQWWETSPRGTPYTFKVTAYARSKIYDGDFILDPRLVKVAFATVMRTKPQTRAFDFAVGAGFTSPLGLASIAVGTTQHRAAVHAPSRIDAGCGLGLAAIAIGRTRHRAAITLSFVP